MLAFNLLILLKIAVLNDFSWRSTNAQTIAILLIILWVAGLVSTYTLGGFIHLLLVIALIMLLVGFVQGRRIS